MSRISPHWEAMADDSMNKVLKTVIISLYVYGAYCVITELWSMFI